VDFFLATQWKLGALHLCLTLRRCRCQPQLGTPHHRPLAGHLNSFLTPEHLDPGPLHYVMEQPLVLSHLILSTLQFGCVIEQPLSPLSYLFDLINYASLILLNKLSILFHPIIVWPCGQYYKVQGWAHV